VRTELTFQVASRMGAGYRADGARRSSVDGAGARRRREKGGRRVLLERLAAPRDLKNGVIAPIRGGRL
jgi:hypothetical protein